MLNKKKLERPYTNLRLTAGHGHLHALQKGLDRHNREWAYSTSSISLICGTVKCRIHVELKLNQPTGLLYLGRKMEVGKTDPSFHDARR